MLATRIKRLREGMLGFTSETFLQLTDTCDLAKLVGKQLRASNQSVAPGGISLAGRREIINYINKRQLLSPPTYENVDWGLGMTLSWRERDEKGMSFAKQYATCARLYAKKYPTAKFEQPTAEDLAAIGQMASRFTVKHGDLDLYATVRHGDLDEICSHYGHPGGSCWAGGQIRWFMKNGGYAFVFGPKWPITRQTGIARCWAIRIEADLFCVFNGYKNHSGATPEVGEMVKSVFPGLVAKYATVTCKEYKYHWPGHTLTIGTPAAFARHNNNPVITRGFKPNY